MTQKKKQGQEAMWTRIKEKWIEDDIHMVSQSSHNSAVFPEKLCVWGEDPQVGTAQGHPEGGWRGQGPWGAILGTMSLAWLGWEGTPGGFEFSSNPIQVNVGRANFIDPSPLSPSGSPQHVAESTRHHHVPHRHEVFPFEKCFLSSRIPITWNDAEFLIPTMTKMSTLSFVHHPLTGTKSRSSESQGQMLWTETWVPSFFDHWPAESPLTTYILLLASSDSSCIKWEGFN